jgi:exosortase
MNRLPSGPSFAVLSGVSLLLWFRPLLNTFTLASSSDRYTHIFLIIPIAAALIVRDWRERGFDSRFWTPAMGLLVAALLIAGLARWGMPVSSPDLVLAIEMVALVLWWIGSFVLCFGLPAFRAFCFPLLFLFWMVPIPMVAVDSIVAGLQQGSAIAAQALFAIFRVPVARDETILQIPGIVLEVAAECSSIRSSLMLLVTTMVLAQVLLKTGWRKALVILLVVPLSIAKNGLRIFTIGMLTTRVDPSYLNGRLHHNGGIVFFLIALAVIFLLLWWLRRGERRPSSTPHLSPARP